jgi:aspartyl protease family protein
MDSILDGDQIAQLIYLVVLGTVLVSYFLVARQQAVGQILRHAILWGLIFVGVAAAFGLWRDIDSTRAARLTADGAGAITIRAAPDGHFHLTLQINSVPVRLIVDTGATQLVLSQADAARVGLDPARLPYLGQGRTANGIVALARVVLADVVLQAGDLVIRDRDVPAFVNDGQLDVSLLGMGYLRRFASIRIERDQMILER